MADKTVYNECRSLIKRISSSGSLPAADNAYYILPRLKEAASVFKKRADAGFTDRLEKWLSLCSYSVSFDGLCGFLRTCGVSDHEARNVRAYLTVCFCRRLCAGHDVAALYRAAEKIDFEKVCSECSPLESRLSFCPDYEQSDGETKAAYRDALFKKAKAAKTSPLKLLDGVPAHKLTAYLFSDVRSYAAPYFLSVGITAAVLLFILYSLSRSVLICLFSALPLYEFAVFAAGRVFSRILPAKRPFRLKEDAKIPPYLIVITALFERDPEEHIKTLENLYFSEGGANEVYFGILGDLPDSSAKTEPGDEKLINGYTERVRDLNRRYGNRFLLFYRERRYSVSESCYIAPERKRGAVCELVRQIRTGSSGLSVEGDAGTIYNIPYIITLDSDTLLFPGSSDGMIRAAYHPYNRPKTDMKKRTVVSGHGVFQPRMKTKLPDGKSTHFSRVFFPDPGVDCYRGAGFDVFGSVFSRGVFCGKGVIDTEAFYICACGVFPKEKILSHDAAEGCRCRCGDLSDAVMYEGAPKNALSYYRRLGRWIRGDVQSLVLCGRSFAGPDGKTRFDGMTGFDRCVLIGSVIRDITPLFAVIAVFLSLLYGFLPLGSLFALSYIYLTEMPFFLFRRVPRDELAARLCRLFLRVSFLFYEACTAFSAAVTAFCRLLTGRKLLKWTTASVSDGMRDHSGSYFFAFLPSLLSGCALVFFSYGAAFVTGSAFSFSMIASYLTSRAPKQGSRGVSCPALFSEYIKDGFKYFADHVNAEHGYLPPDNFQEFGGVGIAARTSPTDIGLYLLSVIAAADAGVIPKDGVYERLAPTLQTLTRLPKHNGKLYNWYDTRTLSVISGFVSTVDCGNYLCCLLTLRAALCEYEKYDPRIAELCETVGRLVSECDLSDLYDKNSGLFKIGDGTDNCYDLYISEMHTTDIAAVALGFAPVSHIFRLGRPAVRDGDLRGLASWSGTVFEYFMPSLFLSAPDGSLIGRSLDLALRAQKKKCAYAGGGRIFGTSESCYFAFDHKMNYQYKAHGVPSLALCPYENELVISPYSAFLMAGRSKSAEKALLNMKAAGLYGKYGFYEAMDLTKARVGGGYAIIRCFMAHHIGMSMIAAANALYGDIFVKRFCSVQRIAAFLPLLYEKAPLYGTALPKRAAEKRKIPSRTGAEGFIPDAAAVTNTVCTVTADVYGAGLYCKDVCICGFEKDVLRRLSLLCKSDAVFDLLSFPCSFSPSGIEYRRGGMSAILSVSDRFRVFALDVSCSDEGCALCFEPILEKPAGHERHAAYSSLFVTASYENGVLTVKRRSGGGFCIAVAAVSGGRIIPVRFLCRADSFYGKTCEKLFSEAVCDEPGACVFPRLLIKAGCENVRFYIAAAHTEEAAEKELFSVLSEKYVRADVSILPPVDGALFCRVLRCFMRPAPKTASRRSDVPYKGSLYKNGISGDRPILLIDGRGEYGISRMKTVLPRYAQVIVRALICGIDFDTVIIYDGDDQYYRKKKTELLRLTGSLGLTALCGERVFTLEADSDLSALLYDICFYSVCAADMKASAPYEAQKPRLLAVKAEKAVFETRTEDGAAVIACGKSFAPQSFIYSNRLFGALFTDRDGGFCWYVNCRMMRLTEHDTVPGGPSEKLVLYTGGGAYELFSYADECRFYLSRAEWSGKINGLPYKVTAAVDPVLPYKTFNVKYGAECEICYIAEPVIGERAANGTLRFIQNGNTVFMSNAHEPGRPELFINTTLPSVGVFDGVTVTVRAGSGCECTFTVGAVFSKICLDHILKGKTGAEKRYAARVKKALSPFTLRSPDRDLDTMFNTYAPYQALFCRTYARCGYYQLGGAYGFRDQLQDCLCTVYGSPSDVKAHILRCAAHQYREGDVMHWFHPLAKTGVRTRCSDDMLWLIIAVSKYINVTGDADILDIRIRYISSPPLSARERDRYEAAYPSEIRETLLEHCKRAADTVKTGSRGLCLIGGGDWNDGMDLAGVKGRGESVWLSFFACAALIRLAALCRLKNDGSYGKYEKLAAELIAAAEAHGFDGGHYIRGYLDSGKPFGKTGDQACEIDILPQAAAAFMSEDRQRVKSALDAAYAKLFDAENGIFRLFYPPFDGQPDIGYITSYPPGIRENGGQYTHGAIWGAMGYLHAGQTERGYAILSALDPLKRTSGKYGVENYVFSGDIYTADGVYGRGGWSWYTGSAAWYFCAVLEHLLGYREHGGGFEIKPQFCCDFPRFTLLIDRHGTKYTVRAENSKKQTALDGTATDQTFFPCDQGVHTLDLGVN